MKNNYVIDGYIVRIFLNRKDGSSMETIVELHHLERIQEFTMMWCARYDNHTKSFYAYGHIKKNGKDTTVQMQRWLMCPEDGLVVDHINKDTLDNRLDNLRIITNAQNLQNRKSAKSNNKCGIRGVGWCKKSKKWRTRLNVNGKEMSFGLYENIEDAEQAIINGRLKYMPYSEEYSTIY